MLKIRMSLLAALGAIFMQVAATHAVAHTLSDLSGCGGPQTTNLYSLSAETLEQCGFVVYPLDHIVTRADGGEEYHYRVGDHEVIQLKPPAGFDPVHASDGELRAYNLPPRPTDPAAEAAWERDVQNRHLPTPTPFVIGIPRDILELGGSGTTCSTLNWCWGGYVATGATFNQAYMDYSEPTEASTACTGDAVATWTGVGEDPLGQAGTLPHVGGGVLDHTMFYEVWPNESTVQLFPDTVNAGDDIQVTVQWQASSREWYLAVYDSTGGYEDYTYDTTNAYSSATAEWIVERPQSGSTIDPLRNFSTFSTKSDQANSIGMQNYALSALNIQNKSGKTLETTGARSTDHYSGTWNACG